MYQLSSDAALMILLVLSSHVWCSGTPSVDREGYANCPICLVKVCCDVLINADFKHCKKVLAGLSSDGYNID